MQAKKPVLFLLGLLGLMLFSTAAALDAQSLGDFARQQREKQAKNPRKAGKEFTNENLPARPAEEGQTVAATIASPAATAAPASTVATVGTASPAATVGTAGAGGAAPQDRKPEPEDNTKAEDTIKTQDYWQTKFKAARGALAAAEEQQQLALDELQLLEIQQAREITPEVQTEVAAKITAKKEELASKTAATDKAKKALADLESAFNESGAPTEWSKTESQSGDGQQ